MDEVIALEKEIRAAIEAGKVPADALPWALDVMFRPQMPGTRLTRLRTVAESIRTSNRPL